MHILRNTALYNKELIKLDFSAFSYNVIKTKSHHNKNPNIFVFNMFDLKCFLIPIYHVKALHENCSIMIAQRCTASCRFYCPK